MGRGHATWTPPQVQRQTSTRPGSAHRLAAPSRRYFAATPNRGPRMRRRAAVPLAPAPSPSPGRSPSSATHQASGPKPGHRARASSAPGQPATGRGNPVRRMPGFLVFGPADCFQCWTACSTQDCKAQPTVVFSQRRRWAIRSADRSRESTRRVIETVRTIANAGAEFRLTPEAGDPGDTFGCEDPNVLHVDRGENGATITLPAIAAAFPLPAGTLPGS